MIVLSYRMASAEHSDNVSAAVKLYYEKIVFVGSVLHHCHRCWSRDRNVVVCAL